MKENNTYGLKKYAQETNKLIIESLKESLLLLLQDKAIEDITITMLCNKAGVSRMAFYNNFKDKDDIIEKIILDFNQEIKYAIGSPFKFTADVNWYIHLFELIDNNRTIMTLVYSDGFHERYLSIMNNLVLDDQTLSNKEKILRLAWNGSIINVIICWIKNKTLLSKYDMAKYCHDNLTGF